MKAELEFDEFIQIESKLDIRMGSIKEVTRVVNFGTEERTVVTNIGGDTKLIDEEFPSDILVGNIYPFIMNLKPVTMMGIESTAMIMVVKNNGELEFDNYSPGSVLL
jgi:tRNA-binding EMAP/Myf-like protein